MLQQTKGKLWLRVPRCHNAHVHWVCTLFLRVPRVPRGCYIVSAACLLCYLNSCLRVKSKQLLPEFSREFGRLQAARVQLPLSLGCVPSAQMADEVAPSWHPWHPQKKVQTPCTSAFGHRGTLFAKNPIRCVSEKNLTATTESPDGEKCYQSYQSL